MSRAQDLIQQAFSILKDNTDHHLAIEFFDKALSCDDITDAEYATTLKDKAVTFGGLKDYMRASEIFSEVIHKFENSQDNMVRLAVDKSLYNTGIICRDLNLIDAAIESFDLVLERNEGIAPHNVLLVVYDCVFTKSTILEQHKGQMQEAFEGYNHIVSAYNNSKRKDLVLLAAKSLTCMAKICQRPYQLFDKYYYLDKALKLLSENSPVDAFSGSLDAFSLLADVLIIKSEHKKIDGSQENVLDIKNLASLLGNERAKNIINFIEMKKNVFMLNAHIKHP